MREVPEKYRELAARDWIVPVGHVPVRDARRAVKRSLLTMDHAVRCFEATARRLGARGWVEEPASPDGPRRLYLRDDEDPAWMVPSPLLDLAFGETAVTSAAFHLGGEPEIPLDAPDGWKPGDPPYDPEDQLPDILPRGPNMRGGTIEMREGASHFYVRYLNNGLPKETGSSQSDWFLDLFFGGLKPFHVDPRARPPIPPPVSVLCRPGLTRRGHGIEEFSEMLAALDPRRSVPARVLLPAPIPGGPRSTLQSAVAGMRRALWVGEAPESARFIAADGFSGQAVAFGSDRGEALSAVRSRIADLQPLPPGVADRGVTRLADRKARRRDDAGPEQAGPIRDEKGDVVGFTTGLITLSLPGQGGGVPWPDLTPENTPIVMAPLAPPGPKIPAHFEAAGFAPVRLLGEHGRAGWGYLRPRPDTGRDAAHGFLLVGAGIADAVDLGCLDAQIAAAIADVERSFAALRAASSTGEGAGDSRPGFESHAFSCWHYGRGCPWPPHLTSGASGAEFDPASLDADQAEWQVTRVLLGR